MKRHYALEGDNVTHTGMYLPLRGKFCIKDDELDIFWKQYNKSLKKHKDLGVKFNIGLTERPCTYGPVLIDIDMKDLSELKRNYTTQDMLNIVSFYKEAILTYLKEGVDLTASVFEKPAPRTVEKKTKGENGEEKKTKIIKDGFHIMFMNVSVNKEMHKKIHSKVMENVKNETVFSHLGEVTGENNIFDVKAATNVWMVYGATKQDDRYPYSLTGVISDDEWFERNDGDVDPRSFSIRNSTTPSNTKESLEQTEISFPPSNAKSLMDFSSVQNQESEFVSYDVIERVIKLVDMLSIERCDNERTWTELGWCLYNIDSNKLFEVWKQWSKRSPKYKDGDCEFKWKRFKPDGLTISSLYMWASKDNPVAFNEFKRKDSQLLLVTALSKAHFDVASVLYHKYKHVFTCASIKRGFWYRFEKHRWVEMEEGYILLDKMSTELASDVLSLNTFYSKKALKPNTATMDKELSKKQDECLKLLHALKDNTYKHKVLKECCSMFYDTDFMNSLDAQTHVVGFENGVYDTTNLVFRDGRPEDYVSFTTGINYVECDENSDVMVELTDFLNKVLPEQDVQIYVMRLLASYLEGSTRDQKFHIWTGSGANGKSTLIELFELCFGQYCCKLPITLLTKKRNASNSASPEVQNAKGKRFASMQEPDEGDKINVGYMKELSGGDKIYSRGLYSNPIEFKPQFKMLLTCNHLPDIPSLDDGTWRRVRVVNFTSKFVDNPSEGAENEFKKDNTISEKMDNWKEAFMYVLTKHLKDYKMYGIQEPESVMRHTNVFKQKSDKLVEYFEDNIERTNSSSDVLTITKFYSHFKFWWRDTNNTVPPTQKEFKEYIDNKTTYEKNIKGVYVGIRYRHSGDNDAFF
jgi:P4 family phage/plasmid primase-like protien